MSSSHQDTIDLELAKPQQLVLGLNRDRCRQCVLIRQDQRMISENLMMKRHYRTMKSSTTAADSAKQPQSESLLFGQRSSIVVVRAFNDFSA